MNSAVNLSFIATEDLVNLVEKYRQRTYNEDVEYLDNELGGEE
jgi:hypothetical protein